MKLHELHEQPTQLDEKSIKKGIAAAALSAALLATPAATDDKNYTPKPQTATQQKQDKKQDKEQPDTDHIKLVTKIAKKYRVSSDVVDEIVISANKHADTTFPKAEHILAVIGVESSFNPKAVSALKHDPAVGLMQVRPGIWNISKKELSTIDKQIKHGSDILKKYYKKTGSAEDALQAYNLGITSFRRGKRNPRYVAKYNKFLKTIF